MIQRVGSVVLLSLFFLGAAAPKRAPAPKKDPAPAREPQPRPALVITEILYDPISSETDDAQTEWVEIQNIGAQPARLAGLQITSGMKGKIHDAKQRFVLPAVTIAPGEYAVIGIGAAACYAEFKLPPFAAHCGEAKYAWLLNSGDSVAIRDEKSEIIDEVVFSADAPWPSAGRGASIQFVPIEGETPTTANDDPKNWVASNAGNSDDFPGHGRGTPGGPPRSSAATTQPIAAKKR
ncbi:MAG: hypothetical protein QOF78_3476 [Phycisphaerales bacterium]|jgi:hypothetical protein|nr:hypothetical protein [Phycisphaerales bacterium]